jgi:hypothetical protein
LLTTTYGQFACLRRYQVLKQLYVCINTRVFYFDDIPDCI